MTATGTIPVELRVLVFQSVKLLGVAIKEVHGDELYSRIEELRLRMKKVRGQAADIVHEALEETYLELKKSKKDDLHMIAKAFSLMLELINTCESAYRSHRLSHYKLSASKKPHSLVYVFTSHPTEARSRGFLDLSDKIEKLLLVSLTEGFEFIEEHLSHLLRIAVRIDLANNKRPQVQDEAEQIFHTILDPAILDEQVSLRKKGIDVFFRTWVGGDKDGHPKVGPATLVQSLNLSRLKLMGYISLKLDAYQAEISLLDDESDVLRELGKLKSSLKTLKRLRDRDGLKVKAFKKQLTTLRKKIEKKNLSSPYINDVDQLLWLYPAIVLPLEIREDRGLIEEALTKPSLAIARMLVTIKRISAGMEPKWYVRGFVISMCQSSQDMINAVKLTRKMTGSLVIPVVPLFENEKGLTSSVKILTESFKSYNFKAEHEKKWGGRFEVMLGYSDSSKENGVLPGRLMVEKALIELERFILDQRLTPVFFHGSGGSVDRGGGSIKEQIAWWPQSALNIFKVTIQGETVQRHFHEPLILRSQVGKIVDEFSNYQIRKFSRPESVVNFSQAILISYRNLVQDPSFQELASQATPYDFLNLLKIGSRPTKRSGKGKFTLRAIPWILCWTQTRLLLPLWWGTGSSWEKLTKNEREDVRKFYTESPLLQSYMKNLGFTLAKMELGVWKFHVEHTHLTKEQKTHWDELIDYELELVVKFFQDLTGEKDFTWFRPQLGESIYFRSSMIHPLNVLQKISLERKDHVLLRETVTGIACGMLTTG